MVCLIIGAASNSHNRNSAEWQREPVLKAFNSLIENNILVVAMVVDNEAVNGALYRLLVPDLPFFVHVPCAAHTVQLCVHAIMELPSIIGVWSCIQSILAHFSSSKRSRHDMETLQNTFRKGLPVLRLIKPCDTRWSSQLRAAERIFLLKNCIHPVLDENHVALEQGVAFGEYLAALVGLLSTFQIGSKHRITQEYKWNSDKENVLTDQFNNKV
jgi:hypothetical protein